VAIEFFSLSKSYSMTGWRIGFAVGRSVLSGVLIAGLFVPMAGVAGVTSKAAVAALDNSDALVAPVRAELERRRNAGVAALNANGIACEAPHAAMYLWVPLPPGVASAPFTRRVLEETGVVLLPGSGFGPAGEGYFRIALTVGAPRLEEAARRIASVLAAMPRSELAATR
jgi:LL-diaminopimelate aminotransferase